MNVKKVLTNEATRRNGRGSLTRLRNAIADRIDSPLLAIQIRAEEYVSGILLVEWDNPEAVWSGDGFGHRRESEGMVATLSAMSLMQLFAVPCRRCDHGALSMSMGRLAAGEIEETDELLLKDLWDYGVEQGFKRSDFGVPRQSEALYVIGKEDPRL